MLLAVNMFRIKFWGNNYSEVKQNLLPGKKGGKFQLKFWKIPSGGILLLAFDSWYWPLYSSNMKIVLLV